MYVVCERYAPNRWMMDRKTRRASVVSARRTYLIIQWERRGPDDGFLGTAKYFCQEVSVAYHQVVGVHEEGNRWEGIADLPFDYSQP